MGSKLDLEVGFKQNVGKQIEELSVTIPMPKCVNSVSLVPSAGTWTFDQARDYIYIYSRARARARVCVCVCVCVCVHVGGSERDGLNTHMPALGI
jgi:hypothetical protein